MSTGPVDVDGTAVFAAERPRLVGLAYRLLGSVADRMVKRAPCPVLLFNPFRHLAAAPR